MIGEPDAGKPHVRFDEGVQETCDIAARLRPTLQETVGFVPLGLRKTRTRRYEVRLPGTLERRSKNFKYLWLVFRRRSKIL